MRSQGTHLLGTVVAALLLAGCAHLPDIPHPWRADSRAEQSPGQQALATRTERKVAESTTIADLASRQSILPKGSGYDRIARAVLAHDSGTARAELRAKRLQAEAKSRNWLPSVGPSVSLTSLGSVATSLLVDQVLFDNGRRKAEREYTVADVEVAAVSLSTSANRLVHQALTLHVEADGARGRAAVAETALGRLREFDRIMGLRVQGGVANAAEQTVLHQKLIEMQSTLQAEHDAAAMADSELAALAGRPLGETGGITALPMPLPAVTPLTVIQAEAEKERTLAELKVARANHLPGISAGANLLGGGGLGVTGGTSGLSLGTGAALEAVSAGADAAVARAAKAGQDATRQRQALELRVANLDRQAAAQQVVVAEMRANLRRFEAQYRAGVRPLMDLVNQHESLAGVERELVTLRTDRAKAQLDMARDLGVLADGAGI